MLYRTAANRQNATSGAPRQMPYQNTPFFAQMLCNKCKCMDAPDTSSTGKTFIPAQNELYDSSSISSAVHTEARIDICQYWYRPRCQHTVQKYRPMHDGFTNRQQLIRHQEGWHVSWPIRPMLTVEDPKKPYKPHTTFHRNLETL